MRDQILNPEVRAIIEKMARLQYDPDGVDTDVEGISDCLLLLFEKLGTEDVGEVVASAVHDGLITQLQGGDFLGIATWSGSTNGAQLRPTTERWLEEGNDPIRIGLALALDTFPFLEGEKMNAVLSRIARKYPQYSAICRRKIIRRQQQG